MNTEEIIRLYFHVLHITENIKGIIHSYEIVFFIVVNFNSYYVGGDKIKIQEMY
ncbi:hypothetical protein BACFRA24663_16810 [Bacteroides fragilis]